MTSFCRHYPNGLGARNDDGLVVCGRCGGGIPETFIAPPDPTPEQPEVVEMLRRRRQDQEFQERLQRRIREDEEILRRLASDELLVPCPAKTLGVLGFETPTPIPCSLAAGHDGWHTYTITWGEPPSPSAATEAPHSDKEADRG